MISNDEFQQAYANPHNRAIMAQASRPYRSLLSHDEIEQEQRIALWHALAQFVPSYGQQFTSSLFRHVGWQLKSATRRRRRRLDLAELAARQTDPDDWGDLYECLNYLEVDTQEVLRLYYFEEQSLLQIARVRGISRYRVKKMLLTGLRKLRQLWGVCTDGLHQSPPSSTCETSRQQRDSHQ